MTTRLGTAVLLITHDLALAAERAQKVVVMNKGEVVESGRTEDILGNPQHPYTKALLAAAPSVAAIRLKEQPPAYADDPQSRPIPNLVEVRDIFKTYKARGKRLPIQANNGVSFDIPKGKTVALVGESGSGKTTTSKMLLRLVDPTSGSITFDGQDVASMNKSTAAMFRQRVQPIFQDPYSSLNPMHSVGRIIAEPLAFYKRGNMEQRESRVRELLAQVALPHGLVDRRPSQLSGGQRQRVAIARAIALNPDLLICDEPVSALDVMVQAQILKLLSRLQDELGLTYLFISHDLAVVRLISDYVCVMTAGQIVESASTEDLFQNPQHPYTRKLLGSVPGNALTVMGPA
jgi:peptide/nickel transport system ATP-binding protein